MMQSAPAQTKQAELVMLWARLRHAVGRMGWPALLGGMLLIGAVFVEEVAIADLNSSQVQLRKQLGKLRTQLVSPATEGDTPAIQLEQLSAKQQVDELLGSLHTLAKQHEVLLEQGEYRLEEQNGTRLARYRVILPAKASYPHLRAWLDAVSEERVGLQLDDLSFKRENITQEGLEARITFTLLVRSL